jgi:predicted permease
MFPLFTHALRRLARSPGFTIVSVVMLALGIGMSTSTFSITNGVLLSRMPFPDSERLMRIYGTSARSQMMKHSPGNFLDIRAAATSFSSIVGCNDVEDNLSRPGEPPENQWGIAVTANFLPTLGIQPRMGRGFAPDQDRPGKGDVILLTDSLWRRQFGGDPGILGQTLRVGPGMRTVIGILPPSFDHTLLWYGCGYLYPLTLWGPYANQRSDHWISIFGRLKDGVSLSTAQAELATLASRLDHDHPAENGLGGLRATGLAASYVDGSDRKIYWLVVGLAVLVLSIACSNLASVQLARAFGRSHEFSVRKALGADRFSLMAPLLAESLLLTLAGGILGLALAYWCNRLIERYFTGDLTLAIDGTVLSFAALASVLTGLVFGLAPAWLATRVSVGDALKEGSRGSTSSRAQRRLKCSLVVGQIALALVLVSSALSFGIAVRMFMNRDLGWRQDNLVSCVILPPVGTYGERPRSVTLMRNLEARLRQIPGVANVSITDEVPIYGYPDTRNLIVEGAPRLPPGQEPLVFVDKVTANYFGTLEIPLMQGRTFPERYKIGDPAHVIVNEAMARRYWPGRSPLGKRVRLTNVPGWDEVVGVVGNVNMSSDFDAPATDLQMYRGMGTASNALYTLILATSLPAAALDKPVRKVVAGEDPDIVVEEVAGVAENRRRIFQGNDLITISLGSFAFVGFLIAMIGLYGVISQLTAQRSREIGIRMALGADPRAVIRLVLSQGAGLILSGVAAGLIGAVAVNLFYRQTMPELRLPDGLLQAGIAVVLGAVGLFACLLPARRAGATDPVVALREE